MKIGQLIECNMRNIFMENNTQNVVEKLVPDTLKNQNWPYLLMNSLKFYTVSFFLYGYRNLLKLSCRSLAFKPY